MTYIIALGFTFLDVFYQHFECFAQELSVKKDLCVGDIVKKGDEIGSVTQVLKPGKERPDIAGHSLSMLHIELYAKEQKRASRSYEKDKDILRRC